MGTNYYWLTNICAHCQRSTMLHVGKQSMGWGFQFRGYRRDTGSDQDIVSLADWSRIFKTHTGVLVDEEERPVADPLKFLADLRRPTKEQQELEDSPERRGQTSPHPDPKFEWRDSEGFAFYDGEFS